jgi:hypothetical protein
VGIKPLDGGEQGRKALEWICLMIEKCSECIHDGKHFSNQYGGEANGLNIQRSDECRRG